MAATAKSKVGGPGTLGPVVWKSTTGAPTVDNDITDDVKVGDFWINTASNPDTAYICTDNTDGAAVWIAIG